MTAALLLCAGAGSAEEAPPAGAAAGAAATGICSEPIADVHVQVATVRALSAELGAATDGLEDLLAQEPAVAGSDAAALEGYRRDLQTWQAQLAAQQQRILRSREQLAAAQQAIDGAQLRMNACIARETRGRLGSSRPAPPEAPATLGEPPGDGA